MVTSRSNSPEMRRALEQLRTAGIIHRQTSDHQIKVGPYNFYPVKGTIYLDKERSARPERGLDSFIKIISKLRKRTGSDRLADRHPNRDEPIAQKVTVCELWDD